MGTPVEDIKQRLDPFDATQGLGGRSPVGLLRWAELDI